MGSVGGEEAMQDPADREERILVSVRLRPLNDKERARNDVPEWECINDTTIIYRSNLSASDRSLYPTAYTFDRVFRADASTRQVYEEAAKEVALSVVNGINSSIFAYGQTSSGKTYTMSGVTEYTVADIFNYIQKHTEREFVLKFSAIEIYNESVRDLLSTDSTPLRLLDDPERGTVIERLTEATMRDWNHFKELISFCEAQRQIGETSLNEASSRSHQILRLTIESSACEFLGNDKSSSLAASVNFVDLAGSERASQTNSAGTRLKEGCHINRSLLTLGTVIRKLSKGRNGHIPFRDSKLTRILQSSLGGNARTAIICTMSPARIHVEQTRNTLLFASCAKEVSTNAQVNVVVSDKALVKQLQKELARLQSELKTSGSAHSTSDCAALLREKDQEIEMLKTEVKELTLQRDVAQTQIKDMILQAIGDGESSTEFDSVYSQYPKIRVRNVWDFGNQTEEQSSLSVDCEESLRSFIAYSDGHSICSDDNLFQLPDLDKNLRMRSAPLVVSHIGIRDDQKNIEDEQEEDADDQQEEDSCKDVKCIVSEELIRNPHTQPKVVASSLNTYTDSIASSPFANADTSALAEPDNRRDKTDLDSYSPGLQENKRVNHLRQDFVIPSPEKSYASPWLREIGTSSSRSLRFSRSRSCRASLMRNSSSYWFDDEESIQSTTPIGNEKDFTRRPDVLQSKAYVLDQNTYLERLPPWNAGENSVETSAIDDVQNVESSIDKETKSNCPEASTPQIKEEEDLKTMNSPTDHEVSKTGLDPAVSAKNFKDVGVDPVQAEGDSSPDWPSEFKRLQREIVELWDACYVSLVHRTYFFLLFQGDPSDSIYMEVEHRRLSYLKQTFSQGKHTVEDGRILTAQSSMRTIKKERQMLCKQMLRRLSKSERENLYLKWGLLLSSKNRRLQLANRLWSDTKDMEHVRESAAIVAKLVGSVQPEQAFKEMFGLNFAPSPTNRKSLSWTSSMRNIL
ncbi:hypothetical protein HN51_006958 [Arachis hypogaea]|uniref:Kinesin-like protein n=1 Tax=Arachis hypogaea TaxID=3818 RepID=A0A444WR80_ARAHY|nr:kinesin-like protein KIN-7E [Arachis hypogaea]XP_025698972.1 kinesin-like protein KIN-7E [Arachis hypogaea]QHO41006.1 Kinesin-like protein [Arachis hypogaea]QHO41007.1 Kinesin-like protein [Arachis hypogaea]QHO41008.1 Kinesin-like protein [Arachis hypogaea]RYQ79919.1 hypothetical protein Ahy_Scaffold1g106670 isoform D [Arachis hypogaea]